MLFPKNVGLSTITTSLATMIVISNYSVQATAILNRAVAGGVNNAAQIQARQTSVVDLDPPQRSTKVVNLCKEGTSEIDPSISSEQLADGVNSNFPPNFNNTLGGGPWLPDCSTLPSLVSEAECKACQDGAIATWVGESIACTEGSIFCAIFEPACEAACVAYAAYSLYGSMGNCYCKHADCSDAGVRDTGNVLPAPAVHLGGAIFNLTPRPGDDVDVEVASGDTSTDIPACPGVTLGSGPSGVFGVRDVRDIRLDSLSRM
ncbi:hypothetical protein BKA65DRAFT_576480 [Rhexocercosporidium sp. MPI-PUGE-AT-0058]|nr:hypothetical protein BKA65DRAFT_576480 [Rhexocercosporidium sp. MPI-PUGE-AT-0058]